MDKTRPERLLRLSALLHDIGKPRTRDFGPGGVTFHHHEVVGARMARDRMTALRFSKEDVDTVTRLVELHLRFHTYRLGWTDRAVRRYVRDAGPLLDELNELTRCDCTTRNAARARALGQRMDELERRIEELRAEEELDAIRPELDGRQVMDPPGTGPRSRRGPGSGVSPRAAAGAKALSARTRPDGVSTRGGPASVPRRRAPDQSSGQLGPGSPAAKASTIRWASSSWNCTGGDFMK